MQARHERRALISLYGYKLLFAGLVAAVFRLLVFGQLLLHFFAALGANFRAMLALFVQLVLGAQQLNERLFRVVALLKAAARDAQIAAHASAITRRDSGK